MKKLSLSCLRWCSLRQLNRPFGPSATTRHEIDRLNRISAVPLFFLHGSLGEAPVKRARFRRVLLTHIRPRVPWGSPCTTRPRNIFVIAYGRLLGKIYPACAFLKAAPE